MATTIQTIELPKKYRALDTSGNNNHGQIYSGRGLEFDGISDYLTADSVASFGDSDFTMALWAKPDLDGYDSGPGGRMIFSLHNGISNRLLIHIAGADSKIKGYTSSGASSSYSDTALNDNTWHRLVFCKSGDTVTVYVNGVSDGTITLANTPEADCDKFTIGAEIDGGPTYNDNYLGLMSDFQVWDSIWTAADVTYDYLNPEKLALNNSGTSLTNSNLKLWYPMQDGHRGQQSYILDGANSGLGDELVTSWTNSDFITFTSSGSNITQMDAESGDNCYASVTITNGTTYKLQFTCSENITAQIRMSPNTNLTSAQTALSNPTSGLNTVYFTATSAYSYIGFYAASTFSDVQISNFTLKAINDKNHATTVFYGDELVENGTMEVDDNWANYHTGTDTNERSTTQVHGGTYSRKLVSVDTTTGGIQSDNFTSVTGRTYVVNFWVYPDSGTVQRIGVRNGADSDWAVDNNFTGLTQDDWNECEITYTEAAGGGAAYIVLHTNQLAHTMYIDNVSIKEVGLASGWTDADQQLHIPQTALQSYNELAWFSGAGTVDGYITLDSEIATTDNDWSLSFWVFHQDNGASYSFIFGKNTDSKIIALSNSGNAYLSYRETGGTYYNLSDEVLPYGEWIHIVITATADTSMTAYVNGVAKTNSSMSDTELTFQWIMRGYQNMNYNILGSVNEISYYSDVLTADEALDLYNDGKAKSALEASGSAGLVGYWRNNGLSEWKDLKGSNDGNKTAGVTETMLLPAGVDSSRDNQGFLMNKQKDTSNLNLPYGTDSGLVPGYVEVNNSDTLKITGAYTLAAWVKLTLIGDTYQRIVALETAGNAANGYGMYVHTDGKIFNASDSDAKSSSSAEVVADTWTYIVVTADGTDKKIYVNGEETDTASNTNVGAATTSNLLIGKSPAIADRQANGVIDGVLVYNTALSQPQIERNYNATKGSHRN